MENGPNAVSVPNIRISEIYFDLECSLVKVKLALKMQHKNTQKNGGGRSAIV